MIITQGDIVKYVIRHSKDSKLIRENYKDAYIRSVQTNFKHPDIKEYNHNNDVLYVINFIYGNGVGRVMTEIYRDEILTHKIKNVKNFLHNQKHLLNFDV
jgi:hypothetical protein